MHRRNRIFTIADTIQYHSSSTDSASATSSASGPYDAGKPAADFAFFRSLGAPEAGVPIKTDHFALIFCLQGSGSKTVGHFTFNIQPGSLHFVSPKYIHSYHKASDDLLLYTVLFKKEFMDEMSLKEGVLEQLLDCNGDYVPVYSLQEKNYTTIKGILENIEKEAAETEAFAYPIIRVQILHLLYQMHRSCTECAGGPTRYMSRSNQLVHDYHKQVDAHYKELRTVQEYAALLHVSPKYLSELIKSETGETALHTIHRRVFREAQYLLHYSGLSIKEIADQLNFDTSSHFSRFFKQFAGYNPSEAKKESFLHEEHMDAGMPLAG